MKSLVLLVAAIAALALPAQAQDSAADSQGGRRLSTASEIEPAPEGARPDSLDWGDAPDDPYPTLEANNGAWHIIVPGIFMGDGVDGEADGQPDPYATGDDNDGNDDEDGVEFIGPLIPGQEAAVRIRASVPGFVAGWIDFEADGSWDQHDDHILNSMPLPAGMTTLYFEVPSDAVAGETFGRFRFSTSGGLDYEGGAGDGEVEDHAVWIEELSLDWGDAPDPTYPTLEGTGGPSHIIVPGFYLGAGVDPEPDGQPHPSALGDDNNGDDDEDGVTFTTPLTPGEIASVTIVASGSGFLDAWIDFDADGDWSHHNNQIFDEEPLASGVNVLNFNVISGAEIGQTFARFRFSTEGNLSPVGPANDGEVEDYAVFIQGDPVDWGDAPDPTYPTLAGSNGPSHIIVPGFHMGASVDEEWDGQPDPGALGDDNDGQDDEDGVAFTTPLIPGEIGTVVVTMSEVGQLDAWLDFGGDGDWAGPDDQIFTDENLSPGDNTLEFPVPWTAVPGQTFARFRVSWSGNLPYDGPAEAGEVEDHAVLIEEVLRDWGDAPDPPYPTLAGSDGARHIIVPGVFLGASVDADPNGQPDGGALGDDGDGSDDEDGVTFTTALEVGWTASVEVVASTDGVLDAWLDFAGDGNWGEPGDQIFAGQLLVAGVNVLAVDVPVDATLGATTARFRFSTTGGLDYEGPAYDGEVEDHAIIIEVRPLDWGDAPDPPYPTLGGSNGASHAIVPGFHLGASIDAEADGQPDPVALGDDNDGSDDEDGVEFLEPLVQGAPALVRIIASADGKVDAWVDFGGDGVWEEPGDRILYTNVQAGTNDLYISVPVGAAVGQTFARFRFTSQGGYQHDGPALDGEVEDYVITIAEQPTDRGDAPDPPFPTLVGSNGASHIIEPGFFLGSSVDPEAEGQPDPDALGDDTDGNDDEDGIVFTSLLYPGGTADVTVTASQHGGWLDAWVDFAGDGSWSQVDDDIFAARFLGLGANNLSFDVPAGAVPGETFARFRLSREQRLPYSGPAASGEVEDHAVVIVERLDWGDAPDPTYPTLAGSNGARHSVVDGIFMGAAVDIDADGQPDPDALGDDDDGGDDEDGVVFVTPLVPGLPASVTVTVSVAGMLNAWIDWHADGSWAEAGDQVFANVPVVPGPNTLPLNVPPDAAELVQTFARFRFSTLGGLSFGGAALDGEVEDHAVTIGEGATYKAIQLPDVSSLGLDVNASDPFILADDFPCTEAGFITGVQIWASWLNDELPGASDPSQVRFELRIHEDVPAEENPDGYSEPGLILWERSFSAGEFTAGEWESGLEEGWLEPPDGYVWPGDSVCWNYTFQIDEADAFFQLGSPQDTIIYWLSVRAFPQGSPGPLFGWKSSVDHWNDNAVWSTGYPWAGPWYELVYPPGHDLVGQPIDLAFAIVGEAAEDFDWGDAPDPAYPTLAASNGARHMVVPGVSLGAAVDIDADGQPDASALGDDNDGNDDEDGVEFWYPLWPGYETQVWVESSVPGYLFGWIDFNGDGAWDPMGERPFGGESISGSGFQTFYVPAAAVVGTTFARFRFTTLDPGTLWLSPTGPAPDGEVEDYEVVIQEVPRDYGDAPDPPYQTLEASGGASHGPSPPDWPIPLFLGMDVDAEPDGQPDPHALGDDNDGNDDEDGVTFLTPFVPGQTASVEVIADAAGMGGFLSAWIDFDGNGAWEHPGERIIGTWVIPFSSTYDFEVPPDAVTGETFARFRVSWEDLPPTGPAYYGEVEDYEVTIGLDEAFDWGDAPDPTYPTLSASNGANHQIVPGFFLGSGVDDEDDGQPNAGALGDDNDGNDDEDGVTFTTPPVAGQVAAVDIVASAPGFLDAWVDFGGDGIWDEPGDRIAASQPIGAGVNTVPFQVPGDAAVGQTFARFRFSTAGGLPFDGPAAGGEVEDYAIDIGEGEAFKWIQTPDLTAAGIDVNATFPFLLADDFLCTGPGRITEISVWGSWLFDLVPPPEMVSFTLSIHEDIPDTVSPTGHSMPGDVLWVRSFESAEYAFEVWLDGIEEGWMDPPSAYTFPADSLCWLYTFSIEPPDAFHQVGTPEDPVVYWLDVQVSSGHPAASFGWKTSTEHWNDAAAWAIGAEPYAGDWDELAYPPLHPMFPASIDLAFAVTSTYGTGVPEDEQVPEGLGLHQNAPNPFNPATTITYSVPAGGAHVVLEVFGVGGRRVCTLADGLETEGRKSVTWEGVDEAGRELPSGVYFYRMTAGAVVETRKMVLLK